MLFAMMSVLVRYVSETVPLVQAVFFRSVFAIIPVMVIYAWRRELGAAFRTKRPARGHRSRQHVSQFRGAGAPAAGRRRCVFLRGALHHRRSRDSHSQGASEGLSLVHGARRVFRRTGDVAALSPCRALVAAGAAASMVGAACDITAAFTNAGPTIQTHGSPTARPRVLIMFYFSLVCALAGLISLPFSWR